MIIIIIIMIMIIIISGNVVSFGGRSQYSKLLTITKMDEPLLKSSERQRLGVRV